MLDIIWLAKNSQGAFTRIITIILLISKVQTRAVVTTKMC